VEVRVVFEPEEPCGRNQIPVRPAIDRQRLETRLVLHWKPDGLTRMDVLQHFGVLHDDRAVDDHVGDVHRR